MPLDLPLEATPATSSSSGRLAQANQSPDQPRTGNTNLPRANQGSMIGAIDAPEVATAREGRGPLLSAARNRKTSSGLDVVPRPLATVAKPREPWLILTVVAGSREEFRPCRARRRPGREARQPRRVIQRSARLVSSLKRATMVDLAATRNGTGTLNPAAALGPAPVDRSRPRVAAGVLAINLADRAPD